MFAVADARDAVAELRSRGVTIGDPMENPTCFMAIGEDFEGKPTRDPPAQTVTIRRGGSPSNGRPRDACSVLPFREVDCICIGVRVLAPF